MQNFASCKKVLLIIFCQITFVFFSCQNTHVSETEGADCISILFIGSSHVFVGNVPGQLQAISKSHGIKVIYKDISKHGNRGGTLSELSAVAISEMQTKKYDYIVLQDQTRKSSNDIDGLLNAIRILCDTARENGATPVIYNSAWATVNGRPDKERLKASTELSKKAADENDAVLVNVADAWIYAYHIIPGISLYTRFDLRGPHANSAGAFLTACVFAATLFDMQIIDVPKNNRYKGREADALAQAAWDFVNVK